MKLNPGAWVDRDPVPHVGTTVKPGIIGYKNDIVSHRRNRSVGSTTKATIGKHHRFVDDQGAAASNLKNSIGDNSG